MFTNALMHYGISQVTEKLMPLRILMQVQSSQPPKETPYAKTDV